MIKIAICDDSQYCIERISNLLIEYSKNKNFKIEVSEFLCSDNLIKSDLSRYDIIFLDVEMNEENGIDVAKRIREYNKEVLLVYVSALIHYAPAGYEVRARAYILKNDLDVLFGDTMDTLLKELSFREYTYDFKDENEDISIALKNILFIESFNKTVLIHTINHIKQNYEIRMKISDLEKAFSDKGFLKIHKSYLVNMENIVKMRNYKAYLKNGVELNVSQRKWAKIHSEYIDWKGRI